MKYYILQIGNGLYYSQKKDTFTSYIEYATKYKNKKQAIKITAWLDNLDIKYKFIDYKLNESN